jgi:undecaprenyl-diphosphatase
MPVASLYERSFPSGHAQAAFGTATYVSLVYPRLAVPAAVVAVLIGVSRIYLGVHFPIDVLAGALLGIGFSVCGFLLRRRALAAHRPASPGS